MSSLYHSSCFQSSNRPYLFFLFFFNDTATTEIYTLSLHDALPILGPTTATMGQPFAYEIVVRNPDLISKRDRKSTRLNSSHTVISYAVFCLKKKKKTRRATQASSPSHGRLRTPTSGTDVYPGTTTS